MIRSKKLFSIPHTKCFAFCFGLLLSILSVCVFFTSSSSALDFTSGFSTPLSGATVKFWYQGGYTTVPMRSVYHGNTLRMFRYSGDTTLDTTIREINFATGWAPSQASIVHFGIRISKSGNNVPLGFEGLVGNGMAILARNCMDIEDVDTANGSMTSFWQCDYWSYKEESEPGNGYGFSLAGDIFYSSGSTFYIDVLGQVDFLVLANPINASTITNVGNQITQAIEDLEDTMQVIGGGPTPAQIESAVESAIADSGVVAEQRATTRAIEAQTQQQHDDYEAEVEREEAKQEELEEQAGDLSLSAQNPGNPFATFFNASGCVNMPVVGGWFGNPNLRVCSPYPSIIRFIFDFVGSAIILGFLIRIYLKHLSGGFQS